MSHEYRHPDEIGGATFLVLLLLFVGYCWFLYDIVGNFKPCDDRQYPTALICID
ncbi:hypothetical protein J2X12_003474 [Pseudarthrobacter oxydans]|uniref:Uncharacterized protein n=1 Tax=Pseudarthrobacter oxydans TaxID=1671 RepID=A0AAW8NFC1_PSEOX|nr:hypothetical protein [Pseudarthrobacter oxydans]MDR7165425.1 hypothetical protein [Pseudarthrobacter oxydans]